MSETTFKDAEAFLADLGVERRPIVVRLPEPDDEGAVAEPELSIAPLGSLEDDEPAVVPTTPEHEEAVGATLATIRRMTAAAPASEGRLRRKLEERDLAEEVIEGAMTRARAERLVDDDALAAALVAEWRAAGHGEARLQRDLRAREFDDGTIARAVAVVAADDPMVVAFGLARARAEKMRHVPPETAYRRIAEYVARRGHPEAIARKAARDAVYDDREREWTAGH